MMRKVKRKMQKQTTMKKTYIAPEMMDVQLFEGDNLASPSLTVASGANNQVSEEEDIFVKDGGENLDSDNFWGDDWSQ